MKSQKPNSQVSHKKGRSARTLREQVGKSAGGAFVSSRRVDLHAGTVEVETGFLFFYFAYKPCVVLCLFFQSQNTSFLYFESILPVQKKTRAKSY